MVAAWRRFGYHALTFGFLLGETLRRLTGTPVRELLRQNLTEPIGVADDVHFGVPAQHIDRVVHQHPAKGSPSPEPSPGSPAARAEPPGVRIDADRANRRDLLTADIPSFGSMTARGAALLYAGLLGHGEGAPLLDPERLQDITAVAFTGPDRVMGMPTRWSTGYSVDRPGTTSSRPGSTFGMLGAGGSGAYADIDTESLSRSCATGSVRISLPSPPSTTSCPAPTRHRRTARPLLLRPGWSAWAIRS